jgi:hypothetical protein
MFYGFLKRPYFSGMSSPQIAAVLNWRNDQNKSGLFSVYLRITINRISRYHKIRIPKKIREDEWSQTEDCWVKSSHPFAFEINNKICETKNIVYDPVKRSYNFLNLFITRRVTGKCYTELLLIRPHLILDF